MFIMLTCGDSTGFDPYSSITPVGF